MSIAGRTYYAFCRNRLGHALAKQGLRALRRLGVRRSFHMPLDALELGHTEAAGLMRLWTRIHWSSGDGMMPSDQLLAVYWLAATWPAEGDVVELGAWVGLTTTYLATACRVRGSGRVWAVDTFRGTKEGETTYPSVQRLGGDTLGAFHAQIERAGLSDVVEAVVGYTGEVAREYRGAPIRVLLIDADHSYAGVRSDFERWSPMVVEGGLIIFHDYLMPAVARFVDEMLCDCEDFEAAPGHVVQNVMAVTKRAGRPVPAIQPRDDRNIIASCETEIMVG